MIHTSPLPAVSAARPAAATARTNKTGPRDSAESGHNGRSRFGSGNGTNPLQLEVWAGPASVPGAGSVSARQTPGGMMKIHDSTTTDRGFAIIKFADHYGVACSLPKHRGQEWQIKEDW